jgi:hypothetical protein
MRRSYWDYPEIDEWDDEARDDRQIIIGAGFGFGCFPRRFCFPRQFFCFPRRFCFPRQFFCFPRQFSCFPRQVCFPRRSCYPM